MLNYLKSDSVFGWFISSINYISGDNIRFVSLQLEARPKVRAKTYGIKSQRSTWNSTPHRNRTVTVSEKSFWLHMYRNICTIYCYFPIFKNNLLGEKSIYRKTGESIAWNFFLQYFQHHLINWYQCCMIKMVIIIKPVTLFSRSHNKSFLVMFGLL